MNMNLDKHLTGRLTLERDGSDFLGTRRITLLRGIAESGSISAAARTIGMSYKAAWDAVDAMNNLADRPLVVSGAGGKHGGGSQVTDHGLRQIELFGILEREYRRMLERIEAAGDELGEHLQWIRNLNMVTSARNHFLGHVVGITPGPVNAEVVLDIGGNDRVTAVITYHSLETLGLEEGVEAYALIKAPSVIVTRADDSLRLSTRNRLCGAVSRLQTGPVNAEVAIELKGGKTVVAVITSESAERLGLHEGADACAAFKASSVILAVTR
ncbi:MAG: TOBE domain-containing protein [Acidihalobacter sp.]|uniref:TOBE domain-containing protein n=1 Tax=Acidihalobacter sp. TaxID=1872108 RepID=UPI00307F8437